MDAVAALCAYSWPGNIRELVNVVERAILTCPGNMITCEHLPFHSSAKDTGKATSLNLRDMEKLYIQMAMRRAGGIKTHAAELLGITRKTLFERIKSYGMEDLFQDEK